MKTFGKLTKKLTALLLIAVIMISCTACTGKRYKTAKNLDLNNIVTVNVWYTDDVYTSYLERAASEFNEANDMVRLNIQKVDTRDYLDNIYNGSVNGDENTADIYLLTSDKLGRAYLMGIAAENDIYGYNYTTYNYGDAGIKSACYNNRLYGYPLTYNTAVMLYNKKYVSQPQSFEDIKNFCSSYTVNDDNKDVSIINTWDVSDPFLNYAFAGQYMDIGGQNGDNKSEVNLAESQLTGSLGAYTKLKDDYGLTVSDTDESSCIDLFKQGKLIYTIIETDRLCEVQDSDVDFGACSIPALTDSYDTKAMSYTTLAVVNPYAKNLAVAKAVANSLSYDYADEIKKYTGRLSARIDIYNKLEAKNRDLYKAVADAYSDTVTKAKLLGADNIYSEYGMVIKSIWAGGELEASVEELKNTMSSIKQ